MKSTPFSRIAGIMAMAQSLMTNMNLSAMQALKQAGAADYRSRGKGKGTSFSKRLGRRGRQKVMVCTMNREIERHRRQGLHNAVVNGFTIMQQRSKGVI